MAAILNFAWKDCLDTNLRTPSNFFLFCSLFWTFSYRWHILTIKIPREFIYEHKHPHYLTTAPDPPQSYDIIWGTKLTLNDTKPETEVYNSKIVGFNLIKLAHPCFVYRLSHIWFVSHNLIKDTSLKTDKYKFTPLFIYGITTLK